MTLRMACTSTMFRFSLKQMRPECMKPWILSRQIRHTQLNKTCSARHFCLFSSVSVRNPTNRIKYTHLPSAAIHEGVQRHMCYDAYGAEVYLPKYLETEESIEPFLAQYDTLLIDCDGVLYGTDHFTQFSGIQQAIERLRSAGKKLIFVTNNSMHAREAYIEKFKDLAGFDVGVSDIYSVPYASAIYLKNTAQTKKCYVIGSLGMQRELEQVGIPAIGMGADTDPISEFKDDLLKHHIDPDVDSVLIGFDVNFSYNKLLKAASYINNPKCHFVATNDREVRLPIGPSHVQPLSGAILQAVMATSPRTPVIIGKPYKYLMDSILDGYPELNLHRTVMIGDALKTDIAFANNVGIDSVLVMSGSTSAHDLQLNYKYKQYPLPTFVTSSFSKFGQN